MDTKDEKAAEPVFEAKAFIRTVGGTGFGNFSSTKMRVPHVSILRHGENQKLQPSQITPQKSPSVHRMGLREILGLR
jgi:hypothetical protein